ncbi:Si:dkey-56d12.4 protein [Operophtera brumata]|uniref:Si:dkey-56d12.4 protein n=1 Tax=Operophtera brumata TaxID=104452 RepID=A0A0L7LPW2_OPEBR|nr:Si:dkey-56d12.4 protein [Operophtera brumata]
MHLNDEESKNTVPYLTVSSGRVTDGTHEADQRILNEQALKITLARIRANPQLYIGIPTNCYHLIELLHKQTHISTTHILLCLKKVKLDTHFEELADQFGIMADEAQDIFIQNIPILAKSLESFIVNMESADNIQSNLPILFRAEHHNTTSVIDSLELKVQPQTAKSKELTQTDRGNTVKYLISCSPNGLIKYVSPGYGGRHSDERLLKNTKYLERFQPGACIIVNNGFKNAEPMLKRKGLKLVRPRAHKRSPTLHGVARPEGLDAPCSKYEDNRMLSDIERVVQRVRDYTMIRDHSVISSELVRVLDEAVVISCALINLQSFEQALKITLAHIRANPQLYIGIPTNCYHLIELLHKQTHISTTHILLCLKKVKLDTHFEELADQFGIMADEAQDIFIQNIPILAKTLESFIVNMDSDEDIQTNNLLIPFRAEHHNTTSVIDSLELKVQPQTAKSKELTQTDRGNTVKYLISCTPNGLINYVSPGYVGRHSDERLLENTKYLERFQPGACIIVNNGFRNAEPVLKRKGLKLVRPRAHKRSPTFHGAAQPEGLDAPCSKYEDKRMLNDIERVVQRVRDYTMIRDHSVISSELVRVLDEAVVISCALINLQSFVIN